MVDLAEFSLTEIMTALIEQADDDGMRLPHIICAISPKDVIGSLHAAAIRDSRAALVELRAALAYRAQRDR
jgi:hypothetical protein